MKHRATFYGYMRDGVPVLTNKDGFKAFVKSLNTDQFQITVEARKKPRTSQQNRYMWGVVYPITAVAMSDVTGEPVSIEEVHDFFRRKYWFREIVDMETGEVERVPKSTTVMDTVDAMAYVENVRAFVSQYLGVRIPDPNEQVEMEFSNE